GVYFLYLDNRFRQNPNRINKDTALSHQCFVQYSAMPHLFSALHINSNNSCCLAGTALMRPCCRALRVVTFGRGGQPAARRCSCSEVWLQERRSEQQAVRPSLFIREEMMLQPQPHINVLISSRAVLRFEGVGRKETSGKTQLLPASYCSPTDILTAVMYPMWC
ncbi:hypothetical protein XENOCAPTIV_001106, partial [Xenoophorus captivus]